MQEVIKNNIKQVLEALGFADLDFVVEHPNDLSHGDYATNAALVASGLSQSGPRTLAEEIKQALESQIKEVERIEIAGPGFINFFLTREFLTGELAQALEDGSAWGSNQDQAQEEVLIEYTSPNLFKPIHVGNLVGNIIGESLARLYVFSGAKVRRVNYPSDIGLTVAKGIWGLDKVGADLENINDIGRAYVAGNKAYETDDQAKAEIQEINRLLYSGQDQDLNRLRERGIKTSLERLDELCRLLGTSFDLTFFESQTGPVGVEVVKAGLAEGVFENSDGAVVYRGEKVGLHTRVFINSQGLPTYEAKDLGNFKIKQDNYPNWSQSLVVTGNEQSEYFKVIISAVKELFPQAKKGSIEHIPTGFLTLSTGKMSSREGRVLTGEALIEDLRAEAVSRAEETRAEDVSSLSDVIAVAALKYQILRQRVGSDIVFSQQQALSFEGDSGPYLQYTHARTISVLEKAKAVGFEPSTVNSPESSYAIEKLIYRFPEVISQALADRSPHHLVSFLTELAGAFNTFYGQQKIVDPESGETTYRLAITAVVRQTLANGLELLGMKAPDRM